jgi:hypothetical protein
MSVVARMSVATCGEGFPGCRFAGAKLIRATAYGPRAGHPRPIAPITAPASVSLHQRDPAPR